MDTATENNINRVQIVAKAVQELASASDIEAVMKIVSHSARALTGSDGTTFVLKEGTTCYYAEEDAIAPLWKGKRFAMKECISGWSMAHRESVIIPDVFADQRIPHSVYRQTFVKSLVMMPVGINDSVAAIGNYWASGQIPDHEQLVLLQSLADVTAVSMRNIRVQSEMDQLVRERTSELEEANRDLEAFAYSISHDLRAPLRGINGFLEILKEDYVSKLDEQAKEYIRKAQDNSSHMAHLIESLFGFFKMGRKEIRKSWLPMKRLVSEVAESLRQEWPDSEIEFRIAELPGSMADQILIKQVWHNLLSNAVKFSSRKPNTVIEIGGKHNGSEILYYVKDNGAGFDMDYRDKLFGVFQRLHTQREFKGSGIGLAMVHKIIGRHGGRVWAEAVVDEGATFFFTLP